ncbi:hypothetical protein ACRAWF_28945 [Streptomyces sp. L7]
MPIALWALTRRRLRHPGPRRFVIVGLVPTMAADLGVSLSRPQALTGLSLYALGVAIGAPPVSALSGRWPPCEALTAARHALMLLFTAEATCSHGSRRATARSSSARVLTGLAHGVFFSIGSTIATSLRPARAKAASAIAAMSSDSPSARWSPARCRWGPSSAGSSAGARRSSRRNRRPLGLVAFVASPCSLRAAASSPGPRRPACCIKLEPLRRQPRLLLVYAMTAVGCGGSFITPPTYLAPILQQIGGISAGGVGLVLLVYGTSVAVRQRLGAASSRTSAAGSARSRLIFLRTRGGAVRAERHRAVADRRRADPVLAWGAFAFGNVPGPAGLCRAAGRRAHAPQGRRCRPPRAWSILAAFNVGIAGGAWGGGLIVEAPGAGPLRPGSGAIVRARRLRFFTVLAGRHRPSLPAAGARRRRRADRRGPH